MSRCIRLINHSGLLSQWDFEKNTLDPALLTVGSGVGVWWLCERGHSWKAIIRNRKNGTGCPYCAGKKVLVGFNDLQMRRPELAKEWDYEKNELTPLQITHGSSIAVWWLCDKGHSWKAPVRDRTKGTGCPICAGKVCLPGFNDLQTLNSSLASKWDFEKNSLLPSQVVPGSEKKVWWSCEQGHSWRAMISNRNAGRGCPYCAGLKALMGFNDLQTLKPELASEWDTSRNIIKPTQVTLMSNKAVWWHCEKGHSWRAEISKRSAGSGCPYCMGQRVLVGFNDLKTVRPELASEWDDEKNNLDSSQVMPSSGKAAWWKCKKGHSWKALIASRSQGNGCPYCSGQRVLRGFNDLETLNPGLARWWDYEMNILLPSQVTTGASKMAWWKCEKGHSWKAQIFSRNHGAECPYCTGRLVLPGYNDLLTLKPELADEWDYSKNTSSPSEVAVCSNKSVWWICEKGHSWKVAINGRSGGRGCPYCAGKKVLQGFNDLKTLAPQIAQQWFQEKNQFTSSQVTVASGKMVWWKCELEHTWKTTVASRTVSGNGCPYCSGQRVLKGFNDLGTLNPELADEWDYEKNLLLPSQVTRSSAKRIWWKCDKGHSWRVAVSDRAKYTGCPHCVGMVPYTPRCVR